MILVDIFVPALDNVYDFKLDENAQIGTLLEEIGEMIGQKEHCEVDGNVEEYMLCSKDTKEILPHKSTLSKCNIKTGGSLILL